MSYRRFARLVVPTVALVLALVAPLAAAESAPAAAAPAAQEALSTSNEAVTAHLEKTRALFLASITNLTPEQWAWKAAPDRWSIGECAEHLVRTESLLRGLTADAAAKPTAPELLAKSHGKSAQVLAMVTDRTTKFQSPEGANPAQQGTTRAYAEVVRDFNFERGRTYELAASRADLEAHAGMHPGFQELDLAAWFYFLSGHTERHTKQIDEVKASPGFPKS
ncbi:MAG: DinB family protein [Myxococcota bacterium]